MCSNPENCHFRVFIEKLFNDVSVVNNDEMRQQKDDVDRHNSSLLAKETARLGPEVFDQFSKFFETNFDFVQLAGHPLGLALFFYRQRNLKSLKK